ncbi:unnamed protein product [Linum trigynum]|uniref:Uncharacterized protein n=1 Tax=Linum trigynum TaxID=586398 RepID=A0AAV2GPT8_9ROSI
MNKLNSHITLSPEQLEISTMQASGWVKTTTTRGNLSARIISGTQQSCQKETPAPPPRSINPASRTIHILLKY